MDEWKNLKDHRDQILIFKEQKEKRINYNLVHHSLAIHCIPCSRQCLSIILWQSWSLNTAGGSLGRWPTQLRRRNSCYSGATKIAGTPTFCVFDQLNWLLRSGLCKGLNCIIKTMWPAQHRVPGVHCLATQTQTEIIFLWCFGMI